MSCRNRTKLVIHVIQHYKALPMVTNSVHCWRGLGTQHTMYSPSIVARLIVWCFGTISVVVTNSCSKGKILKRNAIEAFLPRGMAKSIPWMCSV